MSFADSIAAHKTVCSVIMSSAAVLSLRPEDVSEA